MLGRRFFLAATLVALCPHEGADAHGYTSDPPTRGSFCRQSGGAGSPGCSNLSSTGQGEAMYTPQGVCWQLRNGNYITDYMEKIPDGKICGAGGQFPGLDLPANQWNASKLKVKNGKATITYTFTAFHPTDHIAYYITKQGADNNQPIKRSDLQLLGKFEVPNKAAQVKHEVPIPSNLSGKHTIVTFWVVAQRHGTSENFISCSDVSISGTSGGDDTNPSSSSSTTTTTTTSRPTKPQPPQPTEDSHENEECWWVDDDPTENESGDNNNNNNGGSKYPAWQLGMSYQGGDKVTGSDGKVYKCKPFPYAGWCGVAAAYQPSSGRAWQDAWDLA